MKTIHIAGMCIRISIQGETEVSRHIQRCALCGQKLWDSSTSSEWRTSDLIAEEDGQFTFIQSLVDPDGINNMPPGHCLSLVEN